MNKSLSIILIFLVSVILISCASKPKEKFSHSFYSYQTEEGKKAFLFVLKLKDFDGLHDKAKSTGSGRKKGKGSGGKHGKGGRSKGQDSSQTKKHQKKTDKQMPLQFQMEEIAHRILLAKLGETEICNGRYELGDDEFKNWSYKIRGACRE